MCPFLLNRFAPVSLALLLLGLLSACASKKSAAGWSPAAPAPTPLASPPALPGPFRVLAPDGVVPSVGCTTCYGDGLVTDRIGIAEPNGGPLVAVAGPGSVVVWNAEERTGMVTLDVPREVMFTELAWSEDGSRVYVGGVESSWRAFDTATGKRLAPPMDPVLYLATVHVLVERTSLGTIDARTRCTVAAGRVACALEDGLHLGTVGTSTTGGALVASAASLVAFDPRGETLAVVDPTTRTVRFFRDRKAAFESRAIPGTDAIVDLAFSQDGTTLGFAHARGDDADYRGGSDFFFGMDVATGVARPMTTLRAPRFRIAHDGVGENVALVDRLRGVAAPLPRPTAVLAPLAFSDDDRFLALERGVVIDLAKGALAWTTTEENNYTPPSVRFLEKGHALALGKTATVVHLPTNTVVAEARVAYADSSGARVILGGLERVDATLEVRGGQAPKPGKSALVSLGEKRTVLALDIAATVAGFGPGSIALVEETATGRSLVRIDPQSGQVLCRGDVVFEELGGYQRPSIVFSTDGRGLVLTEPSGSKKLFDARSCTPKGVFDQSRAPFFTGLIAGTRKGVPVAVDSGGTKLRLCDRGDPRVMNDVDPASPKVLCTAGARVSLFDPLAGRTLGTFPELLPSTLRDAEGDEVEIPSSIALSGKYLAAIQAGNLLVYSWQGGTVALVRNEKVTSLAGGGRTVRMQWEGDHLAVVTYAPLGFAFIYQAVNVKAYDDGGRTVRDPSRLPVPIEQIQLPHYRGPFVDTASLAGERIADAVARRAPGTLASHRGDLTVSKSEQFLELTRSRDGERRRLYARVYDGRLGMLALDSDGHFSGDLRVLPALSLAAANGRVVRGNDLPPSYAKADLMSRFLDGR